MEHMRLSFRESVDLVRVITSIYGIFYYSLMLRVFTYADWIANLLKGLFIDFRGVH